MGDFPHPLHILYQTQYSLSSFFQSFFIFFVDSTHPPLPVWHPVRTYSYRPSIKDHKENHGELRAASSVVLLLHLPHPVALLPLGRPHLPNQAQSPPPQRQGRVHHHQLFSMSVVVLREVGHRPVPSPRQTQHSGGRHLTTFSGVQDPALSPEQCLSPSPDLPLCLSYPGHV